MNFQKTLKEFIRELAAKEKLEIAQLVPSVARDPKGSLLRAKSVRFFSNAHRTI